MLGLILAQLACDCLHTGRRGQHADLDRIGEDVLKHRVHLVFDDLGRDVLDGDDTRRVLSNDRDNDAHGEYAVRRHGLEVGLDTGAARAVRARNG